jgi:hypothetical protein
VQPELEAGRVLEQRQRRLAGLGHHESARGGDRAIPGRIDDPPARLDADAEVVRHDDQEA